MSIVPEAWDTVPGRMNPAAKGSRKNKFRDLAPRFGSDLAATIERNRRRSPSYVEDCAIEERSKMARRWDAKTGSYFCAGPKERRDLPSCRCKKWRTAPLFSGVSGVV